MTTPGRLAACTARSSADRLRIIVLGYLVRGPLGGLAWHHLQYVMGLARLGHEVYFVEDSDDYPSCYNPITNKTTTDPTYGLRFAEQVLRDVGLANRWCYYDQHTNTWHGPASDRIRRAASGKQKTIGADAEVLLNLSGVNPLRPWTIDVPTRIFVDTDPVFTQIKHLTDAKARRLACLHNAFFSFGENFGLPGCSIPDDGFPWQPTRQPVVTDAWPLTPGIPKGKLTAVMQWNSYDQATYEGVSYGMKSASFPPYRELPSRVGPILELAVGGPGESLAELSKSGWKVVDPRVPTTDIWTYQAYIQRSRAEFGVAKHGYVVAHSGWFSERSTSYLASGRPVLVQETGFSDWLPTGEGILPFADLDDVVQRLEELQGRYRHHCRVAREIVEAYFSSPQVLISLLDRAIREKAAVEPTVAPLTAAERCSEARR